MGLRCVGCPCALVGVARPALLHTEKFTCKKQKEHRRISIRRVDSGSAIGGDLDFRRSPPKSIRRRRWGIYTPPLLPSYGQTVRRRRERGFSPSGWIEWLGNHCFVSSQTFHSSRNSPFDVRKIVQSSTQPPSLIPRAGAVDYRRDGVPPHRLRCAFPLPPGGAAATGYDRPWDGHWH